MADILLVMPAVNLLPDEAKAVRRAVVPLGLLYLAASLEKAGYEVKILDARIESPIINLLKRELDRNPLLVGFHSHAGDSIESLCRLSAFTKDYKPKIPIVHGGILPSLNPHQALKEKYVDIVVRGEGEITICELAKAIERNDDLGVVDGIAFRKNGHIHLTPTRPYLDLDSLPMLPWHHVLDNVEHYQILLSMKDGCPMYGIALLTSRGCVRKCSFCYTTSYNKEFRTMSSQRVLDEIESAVRELGVKNFVFLDEDFLYDSRWTNRICKGLKERKLNIEFKCNARIDEINEDTLELLTDAGLKSLYIGIETGADSILRKINKRFSQKEIYRTQILMSKYNLSNNYSFLLGYPGETYRELLMAVEMAMHLRRKNRWSFFDVGLYTPVFGTKEFIDLQNKYSFYPDDLEKCKDVHWQTISHKPWLNTPLLYKNLVPALYLTLNPSYRILDKIRTRSLARKIFRIMIEFLKLCVGARLKMKCINLLWEMSLVKVIAVRLSKYFLASRQN